MIGYFQGAKMRVSEIAGNSPVTIADAPDGRGGSWGTNGVILYAPDTRTGIFRVSAAGGTPEQITKPSLPAVTTHRWPQWLPDGKHFLYFGGDHNNARSESAGIYYASLDGKENRMLVRSFAGGRYVNDYLLYLRESTLMARRLDASAGKLLEDAHSIAQNVNFDISTWSGVFSASESEVLVYQMGGGALGTKLQWFDRAGKLLGTALGPESIKDAQLSPDGKRVVATLGDPTSDIWVLDLERGTRSRLTFQGTPNVSGVWSPDGKQIVFMSGRQGANFNLYIKPANGGGEEQPLLPVGTSDRVVGEWTPDGRYVVFYQGSASGDFDIFALPMQGERKPFKVISTPLFDTDPAVSPDGKWIAYSSGTRSEVFVSRFPAGAGKWQVSNAGGAIPHWSRDGKELFYIAPDRTMMRVPVGASGESFEPGVPTALFRSTAVSNPAYSYGVSPDGKRFLINSMDEQTSLPMVMVVNWQADLKKK